MLPSTKNRTMTNQAAWATSTSKWRATEGIVSAMGMLESWIKSWVEDRAISVSRRWELVPNSRNAPITFNRLRVSPSKPKLSLTLILTGGIWLAGPPRCTMNFAGRRLESQNCPLPLSNKFVGGFRAARKPPTIVNIMFLNSICASVFTIHHFRIN